MINKRKNLFSGFALKILAMVLMTLDHLGLFLCLNESTLLIGTIFRYAGRLALPIFIFLLVEGIKKSRNSYRYLKRIAILGLSFFVGQLIVFFVSGDKNLSSPIVDLFVCAITLILLKRKDKFSFFALIPIFYSICNFALINIEMKNGCYFSFFPFFIRLSYPLFSILLAIAFYYAEPISKWILSFSENTKHLVETKYANYAQSCVSAIFLVFIVCIFDLTFKYFGISYCDLPYQIYALLSVIPILLYSGERGYNKPWFKYACYIYAPLHLIVIYLIFILI